MQCPADWKDKHLKGNPRIEEIPKADVMQRLKLATRGLKKGAYHKTKHAPHILRLLQPSAVKRAAPHCQRLFDALAPVAGA